MMAIAVALMMIVAPLLSLRYLLVRVSIKHDSRALV
jgi:hypothetical protein